MLSQRVLMAHGYQWETAYLVPILCIPADVWHQTFDFALITLEDIKLIRMRWWHIVFPSDPRKKMSKQSGNRHGKFSYICACVCLGVGAHIFVQRSVHALLHIFIHSMFTFICMSVFYVLVSTCPFGHGLLLLLPFSIYISFVVSLYGTVRTIWALQVLTEWDLSYLNSFTLFMRWQRITWPWKLLA